MSTWRIPTGLARPISLNDRSGSWHAGWRRDQAVRRIIAQHARWMRIPAQQFVHVRLEITPAVKRRRDADNTAPTVKAAVDGLRDAGVIPDDTTEHVHHHQSVFHPAQRQVTDPCRVWLVVWTDEQEPTP